MKKNKISVSQMIKTSKIDFVSLSKYFLITIGMILIAGIILISTIGFKLGFEYGGGTVVEVVYGVEVSETIYTEEQVKDIIDVAIVDYGLTTSSIQREESSFGDRMVYKMTSKNALSTEQAQRLSDDLYTMLGSYDEADIIQAQYVKVYNVEGIAGDRVTYSAIALAVAVALVFLGVLIRYGLTQAISASLVLILNVLTVIAFVAIARIPLNTAFLAAVFTTFLLTLIGILIVLDKIRSNEKNKEYKKFGKTEHINLALKEVFMILVALLVFSLIAMILISGLGIASIRSFGLPALFGSILSTLSIFLGLPFFYAKIKFRR